MFKKIKILVMLCSFLMCFKAYADDAASQQLSSKLLNVTSMQADFSQTITRQKSGESTQQSSGHMAFVRPGKFRWETLSPTKQLIIANGERLWIYDPELEQVTVQTFRHGAGKTPASLLSDETLKIDKDYHVVSLPVPMAIAGMKEFKLTPKDSNDTLESITLTFLQDRIQQMKLEDRLGNSTSIRFTNVDIGPVPDSLFKFTPPPHVDVIDETKDKK